MNKNITDSHPLPTLRNLKRLFILGDGCFHEVFLFEFSFLYESALFFADTLKQGAGGLVVGVLWHESPFDGFLQYGVSKLLCVHCLIFSFKLWISSCCWR